MQAAPWILLVPGSFLAVLLLSLNIFGDGLRDALDVKEG
jgi:peptide/nickel transport system permease protein